LLDPVPAGWNSVLGGLEGRDCKLATVSERDCSIGSANVFPLRVYVDDRIDGRAKLKSSWRKSVGDHTALHIRGGGPGRPGEVGTKLEVKPTIQRTAAQESVGTTIDALGVDGDSDRKVLGGKLAVSNLIGEKGGDDIFCALSFGILAEAKEKISSEVGYRKVVSWVIDIGGGNGEAGAKLKLGKVG